MLNMIPKWLLVLFLGCTSVPLPCWSLDKMIGDDFSVEESYIQKIHAEKAPNFRGTELNEIPDTSFSLVKETISNESSLKLMEGSKSTLLLTDEKQPRGLVIALHGFTTGPWEFEGLGPELAEKGFHVYAPRLPGHGFKKATGKRHVPSQKYLPKGKEGVKEYENFSHHLINVISESKLDTYVIGSSIGGLIAYDVIKKMQENENPEYIKKAILVDPYFASANPVARFIMSTFSLLNKYTFNKTSLILGSLYLAPASKKKGLIDWSRPGHLSFNLSNLYAIHLFSQKVQKDKTHIFTPIQITKTHYENIVDYNSIKKLATSDNHCIFEFKKHHKVKHGPIHWRQQEDDVGRAKARKIIIDVITKDILYCKPLPNN